MTLRHHLMRPKDVRECVDIVAAHPVVGARYGSAIADLRSAWLRLLGCEAKTAVVFEEVENSRVRIWGVGVSVFVNDDFMREVKTPPFFWIGPELARRVARGNSPVLSDRQLQEANSRGGLNLVVWEGCVRPEDGKRPEIDYELMTAFVEVHRGYFLKEAIGSQAERVEKMRGMMNAGGMFLNPSNGRWVDSLAKAPEEIIREPHIFGARRELASKIHGSWSGTIFLYTPPKFGFSRSEQRLLLAALRGGTDEDLAKELASSLPTVKKMWLSIYQRVSAAVPELIPANAQLDGGISERGKEKKHRLLAYLREHPEELRPTSRKLLRQQFVHAKEGPNEHPA